MDGKIICIFINFPLATESESDVDVRLISITASLLVFSVLTFTTGFLLGSLLIKHAMKSPKQDTVYTWAWPWFSATV